MGVSNAISSGHGFGVLGLLPFRYRGRSAGQASLQDNHFLCLASLRENFLVSVVIEKIFNNYFI